MPCDLFLAGEIDTDFEQLTPRYTLWKSCFAWQRVSINSIRNSQSNFPNSPTHNADGTTDGNYEISTQFYKYVCLIFILSFVLVHSTFTKYPPPPQTHTGLIYL